MKSIFASKTFWLAVGTASYGVFEQFATTDGNPKLLMGIGIGNMILRMITSKSVSLTGEQK